MKRTKDTKKLTLRREVIRTLTSTELKAVIGGAGAGTCNSNTSSGHSREDGTPTC